ncbi:DUF502 domain-containing protein [Silvimonas iriomotensis]|uniref:DUF502 domain-containing protein n=1 Tax=Silvimonas iriomotensis TaxID=449662 RepID=A0ABQ2P5R9_9NEIS|nr:DUF502 domain-containing protein [Silvimonas iriomotensis]GGP18806.1 hypothetical protein GCM10010970_07410 [Silvimonas iriomotensis]
MIKPGLKTLATTWLAGLLALLPLALTLFLIGWLVGTLNRFVGPGSLIGRVFAALGAPFAAGPALSWLAGTLTIIIGIFFLGVAVRSGLKKPMARLVDLTLRRIPLFNSLYNLADRFVALLDKSQAKEADIGAMSPVWCFFGGDGVAVLGLLPNPQPVDLDGRDYLAVLVPTAPIPIGGGLLYVPSAWVKPAQIGVDRLTSIYVSMGITPPPPLRSNAPAA